MLEWSPLRPFRPLLIFVALASVAGLACAADKLAFTSTGTWFVAGEFGNTRAPTQSLIIDMDGGSVTFSTIGQFLISRSRRMQSISMVSLRQQNNMGRELKPLFGVYDCEWLAQSEACGEL